MCVKQRERKCVCASVNELFEGNHFHLMQVPLCGLNLKQKFDIELFSYFAMRCWTLWA